MMTTPLYSREYAPDNTIYSNQHLIPVAPLNAGLAGTFNIINVHHEPEVATICDLLRYVTPATAAPHFVAEFRIVRNPDGTIEWFRYVSADEFSNWLDNVDDQADDSNFIQRQQPGEFFGSQRPVECFACGSHFVPTALHFDICPNCVHN